MRKIVLFFGFLFFLMSCTGNGHIEVSIVEEEVKYIGKTGFASLNKQNEPNYSGKLLNEKEDSQIKNLESSGKSNSQISSRLSFSMQRSFSVSSSNHTNNGPCGGDVEVSVELNKSNGEIKGTLNFNNYCENNQTISGKTNFTGLIDLSTNETSYIKYSHKILTYSSNDYSISETGSFNIKYGSNNIYEANITFKDNLTDKVYKWENYRKEITKIDLGYEDYYNQISVSGKFYDPDYGYVIVSTPNVLIHEKDDYLARSGDVLISGANSSVIKYTALCDVGYKVELDINSDGIIEFDSGIKYVKGSNCRPTIDLMESKITLKAGELLNLKDLKTLDVENQKLIFSWEIYGNSNPNDYILGKVDTDSPEFIGQIGDYVIRGRVSDSNKFSKYIYVTVNVSESDYSESNCETAPLRELNTQFDGFLSSNNVNYDFNSYKFELTKPGILKIYTEGDLDTFGDLRVNCNFAGIVTDDNSGENENFSFEKHTTESFLHLNISSPSKQKGNYKVNVSFQEDDHGNYCNEGSIKDLNSVNSGKFEYGTDKDYYKLNVQNLGRLKFVTGNSNIKWTLFNSNCEQILMGTEGNFGKSITRNGQYFLSLEHLSNSIESYNFTLGFFEDDEPNDCIEDNDDWGIRNVTGNIEYIGDSDIIPVHFIYGSLSINFTAGVNGKINLRDKDCNVIHTWETGINDTSLANLKNTSKYFIEYKSDELQTYTFELNATSPIDNVTGSSSYSSIAVDQNGQPHIASSYLPTIDIEYITKVNGEWVREKIDDYGVRLAIAVDPSGYVHISYGSKDSTLKYATNKSGSWTTKVIGSMHGASFTFPSIAVDSNSYAYICYEYIITGCSSNVTGSWEPLLTFVGKNPYIAIDKSNIPHISYTTDHDLFYATKSGEIFETELIYSNMNENIRFSVIGVDSNNNAYIALPTTSGPHYFSNLSGSWLLQKVFNFEKETYGSPVSIFIDKNNKTHLLFNHSDLKIHYVTNKSGSWETIKLEGGSLQDPGNLVVDPNNGIHILTGTTYQPIE